MANEDRTPGSALTDTLMLSISLLRLKEGDTLVIKLPATSPIADIEVAATAGHAALKRAGVERTGLMIFAGDVELSIIRPDRTTAPTVTCGEETEYQGVRYRCGKDGEHVQNGDPLHLGYVSDPDRSAPRGAGKDGSHWWFSR